MTVITETKSLQAENLEVRLPFEDGEHEVAVAYVTETGRLKAKARRAIIQGGKIIKLL